MDTPERRILEGLCRNVKRLYLGISLCLNYYPAPEVTAALETTMLAKDALDRRLNEVKNGNN
jgi:hypothetical protein